ncbi:MAG: hypothetical protein IID09_07495 [Candidatus Hydrogenedentes bacterium]|nr:hypothetical protein [Candidatus Hydrogenedentota bacterium]
MRGKASLLAAALLIVTGCATTHQALLEPDRQEELREQLAKQAFRGRWWSLYERAFIYQEFDLWEAAEADIRAALSVRDADQRWARTYGLHFVSEYFPNRELGIVLYHQGEFAEAVQHLERSMEQEYTARAAFYLDKARLDLVSAGLLDAGPPEIEILSPVSGVAVGATEIEVRIIARDDTYVSAVEIGGEAMALRVSAREVPITHTVKLVPGENAITITVTDIQGNRVTKELSLQADIDGPAVSFDTPIVLPGIIRGVALDPSGIQGLYVGDLQAVLSTDDSGVTTFEIAVEDLGDTFVPQFRCVDALDNVTEGLIPIDGIVSEAFHREVVFASMPSVVPLNDEIAAIYADGKLLAVFRSAQAEPSAPGPRIQFTNLLDGQRYLKDEIVVSLDVQSQDPIQRIELNGDPIDSIIPGRRTQRISRRIRLDDVGVHEIRATAYDVNGESGTVSVSIERRLPQVEEVSARLSVTLLGDLSRTDDVTLLEHADYVRSQLPILLDDRKRFNVIDRENIETVIDEQRLISALGSVKERRRLGKLQMADFMLIADLRRYANNVEILLHAIDSLTSREVIVDVYGPVGSLQDLRTLTEDLAFRLEQEFPRVRGSVLSVASGGNRVLSSLTRDDRVRKSMYCVVYRPVEVIDPVTQRSLGTDLILVAQGTLRDIRKQGSSIQLLLDSSEDAGGRPLPSDLVITK